MTAYKRARLLKNLSGFTTLELIVTLIILGILSVTIMPKWFSRSGYEEVAMQDEVIATLRAIQIRAMQQSQNSQCHKVHITNEMIGLLATDNGQADNCHVTGSHPQMWHDNLRYDLANEDGSTSVQGTQYHVTFSGTDFHFNHLGQPVGCGPCTITITGSERAVIVEINEQGFIDEG